MSTLINIVTVAVIIWVALIVILAVLIWKLSKGE